MSISRRDFCKAGIGGLIATTFFGGLFSSLFKAPAKKITVEETRQAVIARALDTMEGREALAKAMTEPIKQSLMYQNIGRKLLLVDELPQGALPRYSRLM